MGEVPIIGTFAHKSSPCASADAWVKVVRKNQFKELNIQKSILSI